MAPVIYLDTHVVAWLYASADERFPEGVVTVLEKTVDLRISPMVRLELQYLYEIGRVTEPATEVLDVIESALALSICHAPFPAIVKAAEGYSWTRDPFDRLITASASLFDAPLVTKDETIHRHYPHAFWEIAA